MQILPVGGPKSACSLCPVLRGAKRQRRSAAELGDVLHLEPIRGLWRSRMHTARTLPGRKLGHWMRAFDGDRLRVWRLIVLGESFGHLLLLARRLPNRLLQLAERLPVAALVARAGAAA